VIPYRIADVPPELGEYRISRVAPYRRNMYRVEVTWMDEGGMEHGMKGWAIDRRGAEAFATDALDVIEELQHLIDDADDAARAAFANDPPDEDT